VGLEFVIKPVGGELIVKPLRETDRVIGSEVVNRSLSTWCVWRDFYAVLVTSFYRRCNPTPDKPMTIEHITPAGANIFEELGLPDAENLKLRAQLMMEVRRYVEESDSGRRPYGTNIQTNCMILLLGNIRKNLFVQ